MLKSSDREDSFHKWRTSCILAILDLLVRTLSFYKLCVSTSKCSATAFVVN